jgi:hypothetical protein
MHQRFEAQQAIRTAHLPESPCTIDRGCLVVGHHLFWPLDPIDRSSIYLARTPAGGGKMPTLDLNGSRAAANLRLPLTVVAHLPYIHNTE